MVLKPLYAASAARIKDTVLLVDGTNLLLRILNTASTPTSLTSTEVLTICVQRFMHTLSSQVRKHHSRRIFITFDCGGSARKMSLYPEYKGTRDHKSTIGSVAIFGSDDPVSLLRDKVIAACKLYDLPVIMEQSIEADDILGCQVEALVGMGQRVVVLSNDKDFLQLAQYSDVTIHVPYKKADVTATNFTEYFNAMEKIEIPPSDYLFYKAVAGDKGDNIPGIKGMAFKSLHKKLTQYFNDVPDMRTSFNTSKTDFINEAADRNNHAFEKIMSANRDLLLLNFQLMGLSSDYASARCQSVALRNLGYKSEKPAPMTIVRESSSKLGISLPLTDITSRLMDFKTLYE